MIRRFIRAAISAGIIGGAAIGGGTIGKDVWNLVQVPKSSLEFRNPTESYKNSATSSESLPERQSVIPSLPSLPQYEAKVKKGSLDLFPKPKNTSWHDGGSEL